MRSHAMLTREDARAIGAVTATTVRATDPRLRYRNENGHARRTRETVSDVKIIKSDGTTTIIPGSRARTARGVRKTAERQQADLARERAADILAEREERKRRTLARIGAVGTWA